jgi:hypothetical protein
MTQPTRRPARTPPRLSLLGGFSLVVDGSPVAVQNHAQRVLAYLCLASLAQPAPPAHLRAGPASFTRSSSSRRAAGTPSR